MQQATINNSLLFTCVLFRVGLTAVQQQNRQQVTSSTCLYLIIANSYCCYILNKSDACEGIYTLWKPSGRYSISEFVVRLSNYLE